MKSLASCTWKLKICSVVVRHNNNCGKFYNREEAKEGEEGKKKNQSLGHLNQQCHQAQEDKGFWSS